MEWHLVGGFLGSGKTTLITRAAKHLIEQGLQVGIVTNDQGATLVDSAFAQSLDMPTVEVTGGCFCCNYTDLENQLLNLRDSISPDIIFAESVGSCADLVSTVIKPYQQLSQLEITLNSFSVLTDVRLLRRYLNNQPLPFSDNVVYIFEKQIEEANLMMINKCDLIDKTEADRILHLAKQRFPEKTILLQSAFEDAKVDTWLREIRDSDDLTSLPSIHMDYDKYADGEARLAWLNETIVFTVGESKGHAVIKQFLNDLRHYMKPYPIGHLKVLVANDIQQIKVSLTNNIQDTWKEQIVDLHGYEVHCTINARIEASITDVEHVVEEALKNLKQALPSVTYTRTNQEAFHPQRPVPTHRLT